MMRNRQVSMIVNTAGEQILPYAQALVEKGLGIGILPRLILERIPYQVEIRSLQEPYYREIGIAVKDRKMLSPAAERFLEYL